ncbi:MAG TPA: glycosyltransferase [Segetibacter sp.]|jgi:cellulose synthase/poly-beta-1,6-N-acetylglucosamine synthase-like glycosyltransferase
MWLLIILTLILLAGYALLIESYRRWFLQVQPFNVAEDYTPSLSFSIIIPARDEEEQISKCLLSILHQHYPNDLFEVIVIDDHSTDNTPGIINGLQQQYNNLKLLNLKDILKGQQLNSYKKKAIELAIQQANGDWILTTDADCFVKENWIRTFAAFIEKKQAVFVAAPVKFINTGSFISMFQCLDFMSLQGVTAASLNKKVHSMCNGANLAYNKKVFFEVGGFAGIDNIASGDDMLLMHKIYLKHPDKVEFLLSTDVITETLPMPDWRSFINQRIRWASKADKYDDKRIFAVLVCVYLFNLSFLLLPFASFRYPQVRLLWLVLLVGKTFFEMRFLFPVAKFYNETKLLWWFPVMQPFHILYTIIAGWLGKFGTYKWKGRQVK